jgi:hypothetical protein
MSDDSFQPVLDAETVTPAMAERRAALSGRTIEEPAEVPGDAAREFTDIAPFGAVAGYRPPTVSLASLRAGGLRERPTEAPATEIPERYRNMRFLRPDQSPHNPNLTRQERERNRLLLERGFEIEPDEPDEEEKSAPAPAQRRVVLTAAMVGQMTEREVDEWLERNS